MVSRFPGPRSIICLDNLASHKVPRFVDEVHALGCKIIYTPKYCPEFQPAEPLFSVLKSGLKRMGYEMVEALGVPGAISAVFDSVSSDTCKHLISHCGYL